MDHKSDQLLILEVNGKKEKQQNGLELIFLMAIVQDDKYQNKCKL